MKVSPKKPQKEKHFRSNKQKHSSPKPELNNSPVQPLNRTLSADITPSLVYY